MKGVEVSCENSLITGHLFNCLHWQVLAWPQLLRSHTAASPGKRPAAQKKGESAGVAYTVDNRRINQHCSYLNIVNTSPSQATDVPCTSSLPSLKKDLLRFCWQNLKHKVFLCYCHSNKFCFHSSNSYVVTWKKITSEKCWCKMGLLYESKNKIALPSVSCCKLFVIKMYSPWYCGQPTPKTLPCFAILTFSFHS